MTARQPTASSSDKNPENRGSNSARPAWSSQFSPEVLKELTAMGPIGEISREWAWENSSGEDVRVAVIDSGVEADHPAVGGAVQGGVVIEYDPGTESHLRIEDDNVPEDIYGHGTACAGIIHMLAPEAQIFSVRVISQDLKGKAYQFAGGLKWAIDNGMHVINMSLSTSNKEYFGIFHELADFAYFKNVMLVSAVNNIPAPSYPSLYSSVISVAAHTGKEPFTYYYNPEPPVEFGAPGIDVKVAWKDKAYLTSTGNSFAAPHMAGIVALIRSKHPELTPFQIKTVLLACAANTHRGEKFQNVV